MTIQNRVDTIPDLWGWIAMAGGGIVKPKGRTCYYVWVSWHGEKIWIRKFLHKYRIYDIRMAEQILIQVRSEIRQGIFDPASWGKDKALIFKNAWKLYEEEVQVSANRERSREAIYRLYLESYWKDFVLTDIEEPHISKWFSELPDKVSPSYKVLIKSTLKGFLNHFAITRRKRFKMPKVKVPQKAVPWLTQEEQDKVMEFIPAQYQGMIRFVMLYGCRPSEACNLKKSDIDLKAGTIIFRNRKNAQDNILPIVPKALEILQAQSKVENFQYVFCGNFGWKVNPSPLSEIWIKASRKAYEKYGVKIVPLKNGTRHSLASQLRSRGESLSDIARILGNTEAIVEKNYGRISVERVAEVMEGK